MLRFTGYRIAGRSAGFSRRSSGISSQLRHLRKWGFRYRAPLRVITVASVRQTIFRSPPNEWSLT
jgi:hypothetical protein